jgi:hypothetical protein
MLQKKPLRVRERLTRGPLAVLMVCVAGGYWAVFLWSAILFTPTWLGGAPN